MTGRIIEEAIKKVKVLIPNINEIKVTQVILGLGYTGVRLSDGHAGLCYTFQDEIAQATGHCQISDLAGTMAGSPAVSLAEKAKSWDVSESVVGVATLNALSQIVIDKNPDNYVIQSGDVINHVKVTKKDVVALVGYMQPLVAPLEAKAEKLYIIERTPTRRDEGVLPDTVADEILPKADIVLITGTAIANGTIDHLLKLAAKAEQVAIVGASAGILPEVLFDRGVTIIGGAKIKNADRMMQVVSEGGGTPALKSAIEFITIRPKLSVNLVEEQA